MFAKLFGKAEPTFKERVEDFWVWFAGVADRYGKEIKGKEIGESVIEELIARVIALGPGFAWEMGGEGDGFTMTVSGEGDRHRQLLAQYWHQRAPAVKGWTFYPARKPGRMKELHLNFEEKSFDGNHLWLSATVNRDDEKIDLAVWHPEWAALSERQRWSMVFLFLDEKLGEYGTQRWIGKIEFSEEQLKEAIALNELPAFIAKISEKEGWEDHAPGENTTVYQLEPHDRFARGDVAFGSTMHVPLLNDYLGAEGNLEDPLAGTGADYVYLTLSIEYLPRGEEVDARAVFEDALDARLRAEGLGRLLGGATGSRFGYIDLLIFDGERSVAAIERILGEKKAPGGMHLSYFAKEKRKLGRKIT